ncbi:hypothetical protein [Crenalkalicoccus roseus]|uniref:hypothetical protein n=1 Tax=Crenalkalicoccus roseus TaxID=1485588 RepID=UPI00107FFE12|nr:hypothetical protein [Crenalkalicoccus roseus]
MAGLNAAPLLAALLRHALPGLAVLDAALAEGGLYPWLAGARCGAAAPAALPGPERALLRRFRQGGRPLFGFDPATDAALAAGAPEAWGGAAARLVVLGAAADPAPWLAGGTLVLARAAPEGGWARIILLAGAPAPFERLDLLLTEEERLPALLAALEAAARALGAECGTRRVSPRLATLTLLAGAVEARAALEGEALIADAAAEGRLRLLLGCLPPRPLGLRVILAPGGPLPALFLDGAPHPAEAAGEGVLEARLPPGGVRPAVLGLAGATTPRVRRVEIGP